MLTPKEIQEVLFEQSVLGGYKKEEVDAFIDQVHADYEKIYEENAELIEKIKICVDKIEEYREDEKFLKAAIVNAQKMQEAAEKEIQLKEKAIEISAKEKAEEIIKNAEIEAKKLVTAEQQEFAAFCADNQKKKAELEKELERLENEVSAFRANILTLFDKQIKVIEKLPAVENVIEEDIEETIVEQEVKPLSEEEAALAEEEFYSEEISITDEEIEELLQAEDVPFEVDEGTNLIEETVESQPTEEVEEITTDEVFPLEEIEEEDESPKEKKSRFRNLKFGVDFDVNNDK